MSAPRLLARPAPAQRDALRAALERARRLPLYQEAFVANRLDQRLREEDPVAALARLPVFDRADMARHTAEALTRAVRSALDTNPGTGRINS